MRWLKQNMPGLAIESGSITVCDLRGICSDRTQPPRVVRGAVLELPNGVSFDQPVAVAEALTRFLAEQRFSIRRAAVGLPADWLMVQAHTLPPGNDEETLATLRLTAERAFATEGRKLVIDAWLDSDSGQSRQTLLVAALRNRVEAVQTMAEHAGFKVGSIGSSLMAIASATNVVASQSSLLLRFSATNASVLHQCGGRVSMVKPLAIGGPAVEIRGNDPTWSRQLAGELRRITTPTVSENGSTAVETVVMWDDAELSPQDVASLREELADNLEQPDRWSALGLGQPSSQQPTPDGSWAVAAAVAVAAARPRIKRIDLLHSRLAPPARPRGRRWRWAALIAAVLLIGCGVFAADVTRHARVIDQAEKRLMEFGPQADAARHLRDKLKFTRSWYDRRSLHIDCLVSLTAAFPEVGGVWASNISVQPDMNTILTGKAVDEPRALALFDALKASARITGVKLVYLRQVGRDSKDVSFSFTFRFKGRSSS